MTHGNAKPQTNSGKVLILRALKENRESMTARQIHIATDIYEFNVLRSTLSSMVKQDFLKIDMPSHEFSETRPYKHYRIAEKGMELLARSGLE